MSLETSASKHPSKSQANSQQLKLPPDRCMTRTWFLSPLPPDATGVLRRRLDINGDCQQFPGIQLLRFFREKIQIELDKKKETNSQKILVTDSVTKEYEARALDLRNALGFAEQTTEQRMELNRWVLPWNPSDPRGTSTVGASLRKVRRFLTTQAMSMVETVPIQTFLRHNPCAQITHGWRRLYS